MNKSWKVGALLIGGLAFGAAPAMAAFPTYSGPWVVNFWQDDNRASVGTVCLNFTNSGSPPFGSSIGGTFNSPNVAGWNGSWVQQGDRIRWWGSLGSTATSSEGTLINPNLATGHYSHYQVPPGGVGGVSIGTWSAQPGTAGTAPC
jgi:hypothetical protein